MKMNTPISEKGDVNQKHFIKLAWFTNRHLVGIIHRATFLRVEMWSSNLVYLGEAYCTRSGVSIQVDQDARRQNL